MDTPFVSVIIPVYNGSKYIAEAIKSCVEQDYKHYEVIVVDDGSTDDTAKIVQNYSNVRYIFQENKGAAAARNHGLQYAQGTYYAFLDADDIWVPNKLALQIDIFKQHPETDIVLGQVQQFMSPEVDSGYAARFRIPDDPMPGYIPSALTIKKEAFQKVGNFDETCSSAEFVSWFIRVQEQNLNLKIAPEVVAKRRVHYSNQAITGEQQKLELLRILRASINRRRSKS